MKHCRFFALFNGKLSLAGLILLLVIPAGLLTSFFPARVNLSLQDEASAVTFDDFVLGEGLEVAYQIRGLPRLRLVQLSEGSVSGRAVDYCFDPSASYDLTVHYVDGSAGSSRLDVLVSGRKVLEVRSGGSGSMMKRTAEGINIRQGSSIELVFTGDHDAGFQFSKLVLTPVGTFDGAPGEPEKPESLRVFETGRERDKSRRMLTAYVGSRMDSLMEQRLEELSKLNGPADWRARQEKIRERLPEFFGQFPEKTPLNPRITGRIDREGYTIDKLVFESQPGYYVTSNLYLPKGREYPVPGIVFTCGHSSVGKASRLYHEACLGLVLKGYVVLAFDPIAQGERSEYVNPETGENMFNSPGDQHMYFSWPSFFVDWSLAGLRVWDGVRAVDYLVSRPEVDRSRLGVVGNSGGGQMAFLIAAVDERIQACVAAHPGGMDENMYLKGWGQGEHALIDHEILSLIPPRPCRVLVGRESGEDSKHRPKYEDMLLFYKGLGAEEKVEFTLVHGLHDMRQPKRKASYEWFNRWFGKEGEGKEEPVLQPEGERSLWCTESGSTLTSLGSETGQTLNVRRLEHIYRPADDSRELKRNIAGRLGLIVPAGNREPVVSSLKSFASGGTRIEKFTYQSEPGIVVPSLLFLPGEIAPESPVYLFVSDKGKPRSLDDAGLPGLLVSEGSVVMAIDVRGTGETSPTPRVMLNQSFDSEERPINPKHHLIMRSSQNIASNQCPSFGRTMTGMRALDVLKAIEFIKSREDLSGRELILAGDGAGGLWALLAAVFNPRVDGIITLGTVPSYKLFITNQYYNEWHYFWVPGVLRDFDIPDLAGLVAPKTQLWLDPLDATGEVLERGEALHVLGPAGNLHVITTGGNQAFEYLRMVKMHFE